ncbi:ABC transporter substrate-binding protein [Aquitalea sp. LB_tupeE]|uniref:substrate-binding periplasmic protein n=1 Tax=Aquitalea sp. LB_tupeE TaxID=2748078 RepID=UPI0015BF7488|nr:transporter substrate-binding domain-containing protein [Aquitalea sp. LB_tupeE]NWK78993.1 transporter substrate-binding domain-containing protein [Aquitalea sp. LB_tupeE]
MPVIRRLLSCLNLVCTVLLLNSLAQPAVAEARLLVVTENESWLNTVDGQGSLVGASTRKVKDILARAGLKADFQVLPWARAYRIASTRPNTLIYSIARTSIRENQFVWLSQIAYMQRVFYRLHGETSVAPQNLEQVKNCCKVCVGNRDVQEEFLVKAGFQENSQYITTNSQQECPRLLQSGAAQLLIADPDQLRSQLIRLKLPEQQFDAVFTLPQGDPLYLAANPASDPQLLQAISEAAHALRQR